MAPPAAHTLTPLALRERCLELAAELGFDACGITGTEPVPHGDLLTSWLSAGHHGDMGYLPRQAAVRREPAKAWPEARSVVVVLHNYYSDKLGESSSYRVAKYAQGDDYHRVTKKLLDRLGAMLCADAGAGSWRSFVDAGPMPERELAQRAGLGWMGKNTMLISPAIGSFTFIGVALTDLEIARDHPFEADRCGSCTLCLEACPTEAFIEPRLLDATRCISYLTIESRREIPEALRPDVGDWLFGCDVCQDVCPWNEKFAAPSREPAFAPRPAEDWPTLAEIGRMSEADFDRAFGESALERPRLAGLQRNARVIAENRKG